MEPFYSVPVYCVVTLMKSNVCNSNIIHSFTTYFYHMLSNYLNYLPTYLPNYLRLINNDFSVSAEETSSLQ